MRCTFYPQRIVVLCQTGFSGFFTVNLMFTLSWQTKLVSEKTVLAVQVKKLMRDVAKVSDGENAILMFA